MKNQIVQVCVSVPIEKIEDLLNFATKLRSENKVSDAKAPGWDAKAIHEIAQKKYGGLRELFEHHGWPERGSEMMRQVQSRIKNEYGSVEKFVAKHRNK